jgi:hypothetical protein
MGKFGIYMEEEINKPRRGIPNSIADVFNEILRSPISDSEVKNRCHSNPSDTN